MMTTAPPRALPAVLVAALALTTVAAAPAAEQGEPAAAVPGVTVTHLANEGFLLTAGRHKVLVDALVGGGVAGYPTLPSGLRADLEAARPPFDEVALVLATHHHADHFDPRAVGAYLSANPRAVFVSTRQAAERLKAGFGRYELVRERVRGVLPAEGERWRLELPGITVEALNLTHGRRRDPPVENLGFLIELGGLVFLHAGDSVATAEDFHRNRLTAEGIDVALLPFWYLSEADGAKAVKDEIAPRRVVAMHLPETGAPASYFGAPGSHEALIAAVQKHVPGAVVLREPLAREVFSPPDAAP